MQHLNGAFNDTRIMTTAITLIFKCNCFAIIISAIMFVLQKCKKFPLQYFIVIILIDVI